MWEPPKNKAKYEILQLVIMRGFISSNSMLRPLSYLNNYTQILGAWGSVVVKALRYYSEGLGIDSQWCH
jgi:hypothetical protein